MQEVKKHSVHSSTSSPGSQVLTGDGYLTSENSGETDEELFSASTSAASQPKPPTSLTEEVIYSSSSSSASSKHPLSQEDAAKRTSAAHRAVIVKRGKKNIVSFPKSTIIMTTEQPFGNPASPAPIKFFSLQPSIIYKFTSTFRDAISVSTDRREYDNLRKIIKHLKLSEDDITSLKASHSIDLRTFQQSDDESSFVLEPQLNIMGEATTTVLDWFFDENIQLKKNELPKQVHSLVTDSLENVLANLLVVTSAVNDTFNAITDGE